MPQYSLRDALGRTGKGIRRRDLPGWNLGGTGPETRGDREFEPDETIYRAAERISVRGVFERHDLQDSHRDTDSVRTWISTHCDPDDPATVVTNEPRRDWNDIGWLPVDGEDSRVISGFHRYSRVTHTDFPTTHETRDWNGDLVPAPQFTYMLTEHQTGLDEPEREKPRFPEIHNEWETGSMPLEWRPFWGEYVTLYGRHIYDVGHSPTKAEIHPGHTIIREHTTAGPLGDGDELVPVNRAIVGMGFSGGFPGGAGDPTGIGDRWAAEFGGVPDQIWGDTTDCWPTDLRDHPLHFELFPPVERPSSNAELRYRIVTSEVILADDWEEVDDFLEVCQFDDPAEGGVNLAFRRWDRSANLPHGFTPESAHSALRPSVDRVGDSHFDVEVDLSRAGDRIPLGYYAIVECGWSRRGSHEIGSYDVTFETLKAHRIDDTWWDDWHLYYGVNGQWGAWWTDDFIEEGEDYSIDATFRVYAVDDVPLLLRDCGVEWDGTDAGNESLDRIHVSIPGPDHLSNVRRERGLHPSGSGDTRHLRVEGIIPGTGSASHEWEIRLDRRSV